MKIMKTSLRILAILLVGLFTISMSDCDRDPTTTGGTHEKTLMEELVGQYQWVSGKRFYLGYTSEIRGKVDPSSKNITGYLENTLRLYSNRTFRMVKTYDTGGIDIELGTWNVDPLFFHITYSSEDVPPYRSDRDIKKEYDWDGTYLTIVVGMGQHTPNHDNGKWNIERWEEHDKFIKIQ